MKRNEGLQVARKSRMMRHVGISLLAIFAVAGLFGLAAQAQTTAKIHYYRSAGDYTGWGVHLWNGSPAAIAEAELTGVTWTNPKAFNGTDSFGQVLTLNLQNANGPVNFIIHKGDEKDNGGGDQAFTPAANGYEVWMIQGNSTKYFTEAAAIAASAQVGDLTKAKALWLDADTIAWNGVAGTSYNLLYDPTGAMKVVSGQIDKAAAEANVCAFPPTGACHVALTASGTISDGQYPKNPNVNGKTKLTTGLSADQAKSLLKGQLLIASYDVSGTKDVTRVQIQSVLDAIYGATAKGATLGVTYNGGAPTVNVWAPTAKSVKLRRFADSSTATYTEHAMTEDAASGVWSVTGASEWNRQFYLFDVQVYVPSVGSVVNNLVTDPYSVSLSQDGAALGDVRSQFVDLNANDADLVPDGWAGLTKPALAAPEDIVVYEAHVRDFSINDSSLADSTYKGTFMAFTDMTSNGMKHLLALKDAGLTHIHLLPAFDIASVTENKSERVEPTISISTRDSEAAQAADRSQDGFNWGYDPYHYGVPEGSYSTNPDGVARIKEFREMVKSLNANGLRVVMDMVYNHTATSGQDDKSVLDKVVPGYYYRYDLNGNLQTSSCCSDTACEYTMMEKLMIDTVTRFAMAYKVDGFRFDLMNLHTRQNMLNLKTKIDEINTADTTRDIYLYGEGWDFGSAKEKGLSDYAKQWNMKGTGIGTFNDKIRDAAHGGYSTDPTQIRHQGFINGLSYDWNGYSYGGREQSDLRNAMATLRMTLKGTVDDYADDPQESVNYVEKHDNETLFDQNVFKMPIGASMADRVRAQNMGMSIVGLAQGIPFIQMGSDILRSKSLDRNSYDSGDWFNKVYWDYSQNNFGVGLPPSNDNSARWGIMRPLLTNTALDPTTDDIQSAAAHLREVLRIRKSSKLFRLETEADINAHVSFYNAGQTPQDGLIVMSLADGAELDPNYETILVFFNANKAQQTFTIAETVGKGFALHPLQLDGVDADAVVKNSAFDNATGQFTIPARTTAVFVSTNLVTPANPPSTIDWVGSMWPSSGSATAINEGAGTGLDVYVQVFEDGVTSASGQGAGIECALHWGKYGAAWTDIAMTYNTDKGNNDEYKAAIPAEALTQPGNYGFTANCNKSGEDKKWNADGDGLLTVIPTADSSPNGNGDVFVHLFEWKWTDIEKECVYLAQKGYRAVQVSPPMEHIVPTADMGGVETNDYPWWVRYQPVTHDVAKMNSRSGTLVEFQRMLNACNAVGVDIYVDAVFNQMAKLEVGGATTGFGTAGTEYDSDAPMYGAQYAAADFHSDCSISSYSVRSQVQGCRLSTMPDLNTGSATVQAKIRKYLQDLLNMGVKGFRIDAAKHIAAPEVAAILNGLTLPGGGKPYIFQETIDVSSGEPIRDWEYTPSGDVTEFGYAQAMANKFNQCGGTLSDLQTLSTYGDLMPSRFAVVFTDNHDNQRGHGAGGNCVVDHRDGKTHELANIFVLAYPYGYPSIMSSYYWSNDPATNTGDSLGPPSVSGGAGSGAETLPVYVGDVLTNCSATYADGKWVCEHRRVSTANMVQFRKVTAGEPVTNWQTISPNHIAFGRNGKGFVAINRESAAATTTYATGMAAGTYCDVTQGEWKADGTGCTGRTIIVNANGQIVDYTLAAMDAFAIHRNAQITNTVSISGKVVDESGMGIPEVTLAGLLGGPVITDANGAYTAIVTRGWSGSVTPQKTGYLFNPGVRVYSNLTGTQASQNYTKISATSLTAGFYQETQANIIYTGTWMNYNSIYANGGTLRYTNRADAAAQFLFEGRGLTLYRTRSIYRGMMRICVDDVCASVDNYNTTSLWNAPWTWPYALSAGVHTVTIRPSAANAYIDVDAVQVWEPLQAGLHQETHPNIGYGGKWTAYASAYANGGTLQYTNRTDATAQFLFEGVGLTLYRTRSIYRGMMEICVDSACKSVDNYSTTTSWNAPWTWPDALEDGVHTVTIRPSAANAYIDVDAVQVWEPLQTGLHQETHPNIGYGGKWTAYASTYANGGTLQYTNRTDAVAQFFFEGGGLTLYRTRSIYRGMMEICVDGVCKSVDNYSATTSWNSPWTWPDILENGMHMVTIRPAVANAYIDMDAVLVQGGVVTIQKTGTGTGIITVGESVCNAACTEFQVPIIAGVTLSVTAAPSEGSTFVGWTLNGATVTGLENVQAGDTVLAEFALQ